MSLFCVFYFHINEFYCWFLHIHEWRPPTSKLEQTVSIAYVCVHLNFCRSNLCSLLFQLQSIISKEKSCIHLILWTLAICRIWNIFVEDLAQTLLRDRKHLYMHSATPYFNNFFEFLYNLSFWPFYWLLKKFDRLYDTKIIIEIWVYVSTRPRMLNLIIRVIYSEMALNSS